MPSRRHGNSKIKPPLMHVCLGRENATCMSVRIANYRLWKRDKSQLYCKNKAGQGQCHVACGNYLLWSVLVIYSSNIVFCTSNLQNVVSFIPVKSEQGFFLICRIVYSVYLTLKVTRKNIVLLSISILKKFVLPNPISHCAQVCPTASSWLVSDFGPSW